MRNTCTRCGSPHGIIIIVTMITFIIIATIITIYPAHENCKEEIGGRTDTSGVSSRRKHGRKYSGHKRKMSRRPN